jgi:carbon starvation protein CstA
MPGLIRQFFGKYMHVIYNVFVVLIMLLVATVFIYTPGDLFITQIVKGESTFDHPVTWIVYGVIFVYYIVATLLPIDKIIGKIYPLFAISMLFMAVALMAVLFIKWPALPELYDGISGEGFTTPIFPALFITIACGAISGFHATQTPLMARCVKSEKMGRPMFYGAMITEGLVALIWATVSMYFFYGGAAQDLGQPLTLQAPEVVTTVSQGWLGTFGGILALLGVVAAPITSGDTALRSARLIIAEFIHLDQKSIMKRIWICIPLFGATLLLLFYNIENPDGFNVIWSYFGWANQTLAVFTLWAITVYLVRERKPFWVTLLPALFMTVVCSTFLMISKNAFGFDMTVGYAVGGTALIIAVAWFCGWYRKEVKN